MTPIRLEDASEHNLQSLTLEIPHGQFTVVTGVSGSGKSSLVFDTLHAASERRFLETLSPHARSFVQRTPSPKLGGLSGLSPSIALSQRSGTRDPRSTVGTLSGLYDTLRLWFASESGLEPRDFSFVTAGACPDCRGLGVRDQVDPQLLIADPEKTLRQGALVPTTKSGYIVYSQVTVDALDTVCRAHDFDVDTKWSDLSTEQQRVIFFGSDRVEVPFGKHSLESRMRWEGIEAKPRELGHYKGIVPTIQGILERDRNENALRFARSVVCPSCEGSRLSERARSVEVRGKGLAELLRLELHEIREWLDGAPDTESRASAIRRLDALLSLGLRHLQLGRAAQSLSGGEYQRVRLATLATTGLAGVTFVFDEPSIGLHASEEQAVLDLLLRLRDTGNTVVVVEHSEAAIRRADHLIELGPGAGVDGGRLIYEGAPASRPQAKVTTPRQPRPALEECERITVRGASLNNLRSVDVDLPLGRLTAIAGVAGAGKSSLVHGVVVEAVAAQLAGRPSRSDAKVTLPDSLRRIVAVDASPIGRNPRSNPATYTGLFDEIRKAFAADPESKALGFTATTFSFNSKAGGRCKVCEGSGREVLGMHGLPDVEIVCSACNGRRFEEEVLTVRLFDRLSILDVLEASIAEARTWFADLPRASAILEALDEVGLGHLQLGQPATTLSGGEAQRVKLAGELAKAGRGGPALIVLDEPTIGLHRADTERLLGVIDRLCEQGHALVVIEHDLDVLRAADQIIELGPGSGREGGRVTATGTADALMASGTVTGQALENDGASDDCSSAISAASPSASPRPIRLRGVRTNNLQDLEVEFPVPGFTVVTGVSGSGKSSLVFDSLYGESRARMTEHLSSHVQRRVGHGGVGGRQVREADGLRPVLGLRQQTHSAASDRRSTVGTASSIHERLRLLWSRGAEPVESGPLLAEQFSFFRAAGRCPNCEGRGTVLRCDPKRLLLDADKPLLDGGLDSKQKTLKTYADPKGRYRAVLEAVAQTHGIDLQKSWNELTGSERALIMHGAGDEEFDAVWRHTAAEGKDVHEWRATWRGFAGEIDREYARRQELGKGSEIEPLLEEVPCESCGGSRLSAVGRETRFGGYTLPDLCRLELSDLPQQFETWNRDLDGASRAGAVWAALCEEIARRVDTMIALGLGHLTLDRSVATLSTGEAQRLRLARQLAEPMSGVAYVLDEPTLGLHPRDTRKLLAAIRSLVDAGNAVIAVEHDPEVAQAADHVLEIGPGAGAAGGQLVASGPPASLPADSRTAHWIGQVDQKAATPARSAISATGWLRVRGAHRHNLQSIDVDIPLGVLTAIEGVSGSGKSTLVREVITRSLLEGRPVGCDSIECPDIQVVVGRDLRRRPARIDCPASLLGIYEPFRKTLAASEAAKTAGFKAAHLTLRPKKGGTCRECGGTGRIRSEFDFLGSTDDRPCEACSGLRFDQPTREVRGTLGLSIADLFSATIDELLTAEDRTSWPKAIRGPLESASRLGLGHLRLGQGADTLSGGELQRLTLAEHLVRPSGSGATLFVLDEPTRGLHPDDVQPLLGAVRGLLAAGHSVLSIEHDRQWIDAADAVITLGPGAGRAGGQLIQTL